MVLVLYISQRQYGIVGDVQKGFDDRQHIENIGCKKNIGHVSLHPEVMNTQLSENIPCVVARSQNHVVAIGRATFEDRQFNENIYCSVARCHFVIISMA